MHTQNVDLWCKTEYPGPDNKRPINWSILHEGYSAEQPSSSK